MAATHRMTDGQPVRSNVSTAAQPHRMAQRTQRKPPRLGHKWAKWALCRDRHKQQSTAAADKQDPWIQERTFSSSKTSPSECFCTKSASAQSREGRDPAARFISSSAPDPDQTGSYWHSVSQKSADHCVWQLTSDLRLQTNFDNDTSFQNCGAVVPLTNAKRQTEMI